MGASGALSRGGAQSRTEVAWPPAQQQWEVTQWSPRAWGDKTWGPGLGLGHLEVMWVGWKERVGVGRRRAFAGGGRGQLGQVTPK